MRCSGEFHGLFVKYPPSAPKTVKGVYRAVVFASHPVVYEGISNSDFFLEGVQIDRIGVVTVFVPLGFVHQNTLLFHQGLSRTGPTLAEHLKIHALARLLLAGSINNIQVSWVKLNRQLSQLCLHAGANDYGGTLMEENISREAGATAGQYTTPEDFQSLILEAGRIPAERNTTYSRIKIKLPLEEFTTVETLEPEFP